MAGRDDATDWESRVRRRREQLGLSQQALAARVGVSRQALTAIEAGRQVPSTALALSLARALRCRVEDLFSQGPPNALPVRGQGGVSGRAVLGRVRGRWVAHPVGATPNVADGLLAPAGLAQPLEDEAALANNVLVAGCAPLLGVLGAHVERRCRGDARVRWLHANSARALDLLADDLVHVAGIHLFEESREADTAALLRERFDGRPMTVIALTRWRQGLLATPGSAVREVEDLAGLEGRFARREAGSGANRLLRARLAEAGLALPDGPVAEGHREVAQLVRWQVADAGMAIEAEALAADLTFVPLTEERFDLVLHADVAATPPVARLLDVLTDRGFRTEAGALPGYETAVAGQRSSVD